MPTIQQENGVKTVAGLPARWGRRAYAELSAALAGEGGARSKRYLKLAALLDDVTNAPLPLDSTDAQLCILAERYANDCASNAATIHDTEALRARMLFICSIRGVTPPNAKLGDTEAIARCTDPAWWRRNLRKVHGRAFEAAAVRLGFVSVKAGAYASDETVARRLGQVARNKAALASVTMRAAWDAAQRVYSAADPETGECELIHAANYGDYIRAQGGVCIGRDYAIGIALEPTRINGRYGVRDGMAPAGVYAKAVPDAVYASVRYTWERVQAAVEVRRSWSPVNNCTDPHWAAHAIQGELVAEFDDEWFQSDEYQKILVPAHVAGEEWHAAEVAARETREATVWTPGIDPATYRRNRRAGAVA